MLFSHNRVTWHVASLSVYVVSQIFLYRELQVKIDAADARHDNIESI
jgi:hypothetical protein